MKYVLGWRIGRVDVTCEQMGVNKNSCGGLGAQGELGVEGFQSGEGGDTEVQALTRGRRAILLQAADSFSSEGC